MRYAKSELRRYVEGLKEELRDETIAGVIALSQSAFLLPLAGKRKRLVISLIMQHPFIYLSDEEAFVKTMKSPFLDRIRKELSGLKIKDVSLAMEDAVITFILEDEERKKERSLVVEMIPRLANLFLLDAKKTVIMSFHEEKRRDLRPGKTYLLPLGERREGETIIDAPYLQARKDADQARRLNDLYGPLKKSVLTRLKALKRKKEKIKEDIRKAAKLKELSSVAEMILTYETDLKRRVPSITIKGKTIELDPARTINENVTAMYHTVRRARRTEELGERNLSYVAVEQKQYEFYIIELTSNDESRMARVHEELVHPHPKARDKISEADRPFFINHHGTIFLFGHNARQNDCLSFALRLDRAFTWLHIKDLSGAHIIIKSKKPTEEELLFGAELALLCSRKRAGEITVTLLKNVRRGKKPGEALIKNHRLIRLNSIRPATIKEKESAQRLKAA